MPTVTATIAIEANLGAGWVNVRADTLLGVEPAEAEYGIRGGGALDRVASTGTLSFAMNNDTTNSAGLAGYYTPGHANVRVGWEIGIPIRLAITYAGTTYYKFRGTLVSVQPDAGQYGRAAVLCVAHDWMDEAAIAFVKDTAVQINQRSDQLINTIVTQTIGRQPAATSYATGKSTFAFAMDNLSDVRTRALRALADVVMAEVGYLYVKGDTTQGGTLTFEDRHARQTASLAATFTETMYALDAVRTRDDIQNHVVAMVHPRKLDAAATTVLYELTPTETTPALAPGETKALSVFYREASGRYVRIGGDSIVTPVASTDYLGNSQADGLGVNLTSSLSLVFASTSNSATLTFTNNHASSTIYLTLLQVRGKALQDRYELAVEAEDAASISAYGEHDLVYDMIFEDRENVAKDIANWFISLYGSPVLSVSTIAIHANQTPTLMTQALAREPGDKIALTESLTAQSARTHFINGVRLSVRAGDILDVAWTLAPAGQVDAWILGTVGRSELGTTTILGFG